MALFRYRKKPIVLLALVALLVAQAAAGLHALKHFGQQGDPVGLASHHAQLCLECISFASVTGAHGGGVTAFAVARLGHDVFAQAGSEAPARQTRQYPFRSRAPPR